MSDDIVARLRAFYTSQTVREAADEIERLRRERDEAEPLLNELWERRTEATEMRAEIERLQSCVATANVYMAQAAAEIERLRARIAELERFAGELDA